jgi:hypothetical protein
MASPGLQYVLRQGKKIAKDAPKSKVMVMIFKGKTGICSNSYKEEHVWRTQKMEYSPKKGHLVNLKWEIVVLL